MYYYVYVCIRPLMEMRVFVPPQTGQASAGRPGQCSQP